MKRMTLWGEVEEPNTKDCSICGEEKHIHEFQLRSGKKENFQDTRENRRNECDVCKSKLNKQTRIAKKVAGKCPDNHSCPICGRNKEQLKGEHNGWQNKSPFVLDHDHETGEPRGYICQHCNIGLGKNGFDENIQSLKNAIEYLETT
jgi:hypothetical protein